MKTDEQLVGFWKRCQFDRLQHFIKTGKLWYQKLNYLHGQRFLCSKNADIHKQIGGCWSRSVLRDVIDLVNEIENSRRSIACDNFAPVFY